MWVHHRLPWAGTAQLHAGRRQEGRDVQTIASLVIDEAGAAKRGRIDLRIRLGEQGQLTVMEQVVDRRIGGSGNGHQKRLEVGTVVQQADRLVCVQLRRRALSGRRVHQRDIAGADLQCLAQPLLQRLEGRVGPLDFIGARTVVTHAEQGTKRHTLDILVAVQDHTARIEELMFEQHFLLLARGDVVLIDDRLVAAHIALDEGDVGVVGKTHHLGDVAVLHVRAEVLLPRVAGRIAELGGDVGTDAVQVLAKTCAQFAVEVGDIAGHALLGLLDTLGSEVAKVDLVDVTGIAARTVDHQDVIRVVGQRVQHRGI